MPVLEINTSINILKLENTMKNKKTMSFMMMVVVLLQLVLVANVFAGPAPGISSYKVAYVGSSTYQLKYGGSGYEKMLYPNQASTVEDHGGAQLYVVTEQLGYDAYTVAKMNGVTCAYAGYEALYVTYPIVAGFRNYWNCSGQQQGTFTATAYSVNTYTPWYTQIYVK